MRRYLQLSGQRPNVITISKFSLINKEKQIAYEENIPKEERWLTN